MASGSLSLRARLVAWLRIKPDACDKCILYAFGARLSSPVYTGAKTGKQAEDLLAKLPVELLMYILRLAAADPESAAAGLGPLGGIIRTSKDLRGLTVDYLTSSVSTLTLNFRDDGEAPSVPEDMELGPPDTEGEQTRMRVFARGKLVVGGPVYSTKQARWLAVFAQKAKEVQFKAKSVSFVPSSSFYLASNVDPDSDQINMYLGVEAVRLITAIPKLRIPSLGLKSESGGVYEKLDETILNNIVNKGVESLVIASYMVTKSDIAIIAGIEGLLSLELSDISTREDDLLRGLEKVASIATLVIGDSPPWLKEEDGTVIGRMPAIQKFVYDPRGGYMPSTNHAFYRNMLKADTGKKPGGPSIVEIQDHELIIETVDDIQRMVITLEYAYPRDINKPLTFSVQRYAADRGWSDILPGMFAEAWNAEKPQLLPVPTLAYVED